MTAVEKTTVMEPCHVGTCGWHYRHWRGRYYPQDLPAARWLRWYARDFDCVEINHSFYRLPTVAAVRTWCGETPPGFSFAVKASRLITHLKKLRRCEAALAKFFRVMDHFGDKRGPVLFQLPPRWHLDLARLRDFVQMLPPRYAYAFEFRDPTWHCEAVYRLLADHDLAFCQFDIGGRRSPAVITAGLIYVRLHGPGTLPYTGCYSQERLSAWAERIREWACQGHEVFVFFDNDENAYAVTDALRLKRLLFNLDRSSLKQKSGY